MKSNAKKKQGKSFCFRPEYLNTCIHTRDQREISFGINDDYDDDDKVFLQWTHIIYSTTKKKIITKQKKAFNKL